MRDQIEICFTTNCVLSSTCSCWRGGGGWEVAWWYGRQDPSNHTPICLWQLEFFGQRSWEPAMLRGNRKHLSFFERNIMKNLNLLTMTVWVLIEIIGNKPLFGCNPSIMASFSLKPYPLIKQDLPYHTYGKDLGLSVWQIFPMGSISSYVKLLKCRTDSFGKKPWTIVGRVLQLST